MAAECDLKANDIVDFSVVKSDREGTYHGAIYINGRLVLIGEGRKTYDEAKADADAEQKSFAATVQSEEIDGGIDQASPSGMVH